MGSPALWRLRHELRRHLSGVIYVVLTAAISIAAASALPMIIQAAIDGPVETGDRSGLFRLAVFAFLLAVVENVLGWQRRNRLAHLATDVETGLRDRLYAKLQALDVGFHDGWQSGQLVQRCVSDLSTIRRFIGFGAIFMVILSIQVVAVLVLIGIQSPAMAIITAVTCAPMFFMTRRLNHRYQLVSRKVQDLEGDLATAVEESATGLRAIKAFGRRPYMLDKFRWAAEDVYDAKLERVRLRTLFQWTLGFIPNMSVAFVMLVGVLLVGDERLTLGGLVATVFYVLMLRWPLEALGWILTMAEEAGTAATRLFEVLDAEPAIADRPDAQPLPTPVTGRLSFEGVRFSYPTAPDDEILSGVDLVLEPGETVALVGATGSGKTTLGNLVPRLYDVDEGRVAIDGVDVRDVPLGDLRSHVGVAFEDATLFSMSVRENLLLGKPDATPDEIEAALETAQAAFVHKLPWGLDTRIGEQGMSLSGGQRQRLALARAIVGQPKVLVLDDPLSALDVHTEALVEEALERVLDGVTALLVVHRPSTVALADRAALLDGGRIVATGTHSELMANEPRYREILAADTDDLVDSGAVA